MSSWINKPVYRPKNSASTNIGFRQLLPAGKIQDKTKDATVVSAFYIMKGKYHLDVYKERMRYFLEHCPCKMIFYTEEAMVPFIRECRRLYEDITDVLVVNKKDWVANKNFKQLEWDSLLVKDVNASSYSAEYYKFLYEKKEFVKRAMAHNPFGHIDFIWVNPTICKDPMILPLIRNFPVSNRIVTDRIMMLNSSPFEFTDEKAKVYAGMPLLGARAGSRISSAIIAGSKEQWLHFSDIYDASVKKFQKANLFWGLDSIVMASIALENKQKVSLVEPKPIVDPSWKSMNGLLYFGAFPSLFSMLTDKTKYDTKMTCEELLQFQCHMGV
jgi:hypothetical protein